MFVLSSNLCKILKSQFFTLKSSTIISHLYKMLLNWIGWYYLELTFASNLYNSDSQKHKIIPMYMFSFSACFTNMDIKLLIFSHHWFSGNNQGQDMCRTKMYWLTMAIKFIKSTMSTIKLTSMHPEHPLSKLTICFAHKIWDTK